MSRVYLTDDRIEFREPMSYGLRIFAFLAGLFPFLTPYELLIRPGWPEFSIFVIIPIIVSAGAIAVGGLFILAGILGMHQCLRFDAASRTIAYAYKTAITSLCEKRYQFADLSTIEIALRDWESRPPT